MVLVYWRALWDQFTISMYVYIYIWNGCCGSSYRSQQQTFQCSKDKVFLASNPQQFINDHFRNPNRRYLRYIRPIFQESHPHMNIPATLVSWYHHELTYIDWLVDIPANGWSIYIIYIAYCIISNIILYLLYYILLYYIILYYIILYHIIYDIILNHIIYIILY